MAGNKNLKNIYALGAVSFLTDVSSEMVFSVLPTFITGELGASKTKLGLIEGVAESSSYLLRIISGCVSDRLGKRKFLILSGYGLSTAVKPFFAIASSWSGALIVRFTDRLGKAIRTAPRDALISASAPAQSLGKAFGIHRTLDQSGAIIGPLIAVLLLPLISYRGIFVLSLIPGILAFAVLFFLVQDAATGKNESRLLESFKEALNPAFVKFLAVVAVFSAGAFNFSFILVRAGEAGIAAWLIPAVYMLINASHALAGIPSGIIADKIGRHKVLAGGYGLLAAANAVLLILPPSPAPVLIGAALFGLYAGVVETTQRAIVPGFVNENLRGTAYGIYYLVVGLCFFAANAAVGLLWDKIGPHAAFIYSLATSIISAVVMASIFGSSGKSSFPGRPI